MIKVLVVEDDKLVRKGLISVMPWQQFGMQVVGEANNGEKALELLESQAVDLLLTDLAMPVMSGIELMRIVRKRFPHVHIVVLTLHQDFEYIQEALRLGAIDYIAKVELEQDQLDEVLGRIAIRIQEQSKHSDVQHVQHEFAPLAPDRGYAVVCLNGVSYREWADNLKLSAHVRIIEADRSSWLLLSEEGDDRNLSQQLSNNVSASENGVLVELSGLAGWTRSEVQRWIRDFAERELFYLYRPDCKIIAICIHKGYQQLAEPAEEELESLKDLWLSAEWLYHDGLFAKLVREIKLLRLPKAKLLGLLYAFVNEWNRLYSQPMLGKITLKEPVYSWFQVEQWLVGIRELVRLAVHKTGYSQQIVDCILKAEQFMRSEMDQPLTAAYVARRMNMSRSYFSQCFKDIIGNTFNEHLRMIRMAKAKQYLLYTNKTIQWIAQHTGYMDDKYFSRTFREFTGMLPSEYRLSKRAEA